MKRSKEMAPPLLGGSSLLTVFALLCMSILALLCLSTAQAEKRLSDASAQAVRDYYRADLEARRIFARLRAGEQVSGVEEENGCVMYTCEISENQTLAVTLEKRGDSWKILRWQTVVRELPSGSELGVWDGNTGKEAAASGRSSSDG